MHNGRGTFIVIEGTDGSGKGTQFKLLVEHLERLGYDVATFDFPQYDQPSSYFVRKYLNGEYGEAAMVGPYTASLFYALDRFETSTRIREALEQGKVVVSNRFTGSSMGHQGTMFRNAEERRGYFIWLDNLEFEMLRIPRPDASLVLRVPAEISQALVDQKEARNYTNKKRDLLEADLTHLQRAVEVYDDLTQLFPKDFMRLDCVRDGELMSIETIQKLIWQKIEPLLPPPSAKPKAQPVPASNASVAERPAVASEVSAEDARSADQAIEAQLQAEFAAAARKDKQVAQAEPFDRPAREEQRPGTLTLANVSDLLAATLQQAGLAVTLDTAGRRLDQKDADGRYPYLVPAYLPTEVQDAYRKQMDRLFGLYADVVSKLAQHLKQTSSTPNAERGKAWKKQINARARQAAQPLLPIATELQVAVPLEARSIRTLAPQLLAHTLPEVQAVGEQLLVTQRASSNNLPEEAIGPSDAVEELARTLLPEYHDAPTQTLGLADVWPRNEFDLVPDMLFEHSSSSLRDLRATVADWPYERRAAVFEAYLREQLRARSSAVFDKVRYTWDLACSYQTLRDLQASGTMDQLTWQTLTPRYGYTVPALIEEAGLVDTFEQCFELSLKLYSSLQQAGFPLEAQYATLFGHRLRATASCNARQAANLHALASRPKTNAGLQQLARQMHAKIAEVHPLLAEAL